METGERVSNWTIVKRLGPWAVLIVVLSYGGREITQWLLVPWVIFGPFVIEGRLEACRDRGIWRSRLDHYLIYLGGFALLAWPWLWIEWQSGRWP